MTDWITEAKALRDKWREKAYDAIPGDQKRTEYLAQKWINCDCHAGGLRDASDEVEDLIARCGWQPIETAPKDGTGVLVCRYGWIRPRCGRWSSGGWWTNDAPLIGNPDLWMPLPAAPKPEGRE